MGLQDLLEFDEAAYKEKAKSMPLSELISRVNEKKNEIKGGYGHSFWGGFFAPSTGGLSLLESAYGARKVDVAEQKLKIISDELERRIDKD
jgi:hypothetical protein